MQDFLSAGKYRCVDRFSLRMHAYFFVYKFFIWHRILSLFLTVFFFLHGEGDIVGKENEDGEFGTRPSRSKGALLPSSLNCLGS